jgi:hypothetical protein
MSNNNTQQDLEKARSEFIEVAGRFSTVPSRFNLKALEAAASELHYQQLFSVTFSEP